MSCVIQFLQYVQYSTAFSFLPVEMNIFLWCKNSQVSAKVPEARIHKNIAYFF